MKILVLIFMFSISFPQLKVGDSAPTFFVRDLDSKNFFLSDSLKNKTPIVLSFFTTWCGPCRLEMPALNSLSKELSNVQFYLVNVSGINKGKKVMREDPVEVEKLIKSLNISLPVLMDKYGKTAEKYSVTMLARLVVIDSKGIIHYIHDGFAVGDELKLKEVLTKLND